MRARLIADDQWYRASTICPLCGDEPGPFPMKPTARGWVCRDCYDANDMGRFEEYAPPKKDEVKK